MGQIRVQSKGSRDMSIFFIFLYFQNSRWKLPCPLCSSNRNRRCSKTSTRQRITNKVNQTFISKFLFSFSFFPRIEHKKHTLLDSIASSGDNEKCIVILDKIMDARIKRINSNNLLKQWNVKLNYEISNQMKRIFQVKEGKQREKRLQCKKWS